MAAELEILGGAQEHPLGNGIDPDDNFFNDVYRGFSQREVSPYYNVNNFNNTFQHETNTFNVMSFNVRSFSKNGEMCMSLMQSLYRAPDIMVLTETWLDEGDQCISAIEGYNALHTIRENGRSGGVSLYSDKTLTVEPIRELTLCTDLIETCVAEVNIGSELMVILAVYRPHSGTVEQFCQILDELLHSQHLRNKSLILLGDLNINLLKQHDQNIVNFMTLMQSFNFLPLITKATRFPSTVENYSPSLLDQIWVNSFRQFSSGIITVDVTDHCPFF